MNEEKISKSNFKFKKIIIKIIKKDLKKRIFIRLIKISKPFCINIY